MTTFADLQRNYDNASPPDDEPERCDECKRTHHPDDMHEQYRARCWEQMDKCGNCGAREHGECRDHDDLEPDE